MSSILNMEEVYFSEKFINAQHVYYYKPEDDKRPWLIFIFLCTYKILMREHTNKTTLLPLNVTISDISVSGDRGSTVVKVLCYKSEGRWFDPSWCQWNFSLT